MTHCVPSWDIEDNSSNPGSLKSSFSKPMSSNLDVPTLDYEVAELTWKNGQLAMQGLGPPRLGGFKSNATRTVALTKYSWDKPHATETLEALVDQATLQPHLKPLMDLYADELVPRLDYNNSSVASGSVSASVTTTMDALVPSSAIQPHHVLMSGSRAACSTRVGSCSVDRSGFIGGDGAIVGVEHELSSCRDQSVSVSATLGMKSSRQLTIETQRPESGSQEDTISGKRSIKSTSPDEHDSVCHSRPQKKELEEKNKGKEKSSLIGTKRSRAATIHNQSERRRRDKINEKMKTLQKLVPNANKTDKASMLDEVIEYLKQLQAQTQMISRMNSLSPMMMPLALQQLQMPMINPMSMGMTMMPAGVMDMNAMSGSHSNIPRMSTVFHPASAPFLMAPWDIHNTGDRVPVPNHTHDPMPSFLASQSQVVF